MRKLNRVGKVIYRNSCKKLKFDNTNKCYMHKPESVWVNETKDFWDFEILTDHLILARRICCPSEPKIKVSEKKKRDEN